MTNGARSSRERVATFSIVARDPATGDLGVAVASRFLAVGSVVPWARAGVGAVATQALPAADHGPRGLALLVEGASAEEVVDALTAADPERRQRQLGVVDARGGAATFTGEAALAWAGGRTGGGYAVQGNVLAGPQVIDAMAAAFETVGGDLPGRLLAALEAGDTVGGDRRGRQSAALLVVREGAGPGGGDRWVDLRVDDHAEPVVELARLLSLHRGREAAARARELLEDAQRRAAGEQGGLLDRAAEAARRATDLDPGNEGHWLVLARVRLARGEADTAALAGVRALEASPWTKRALLEGHLGSRDLMERLLEHESFRRAWEALPLR